MNTTILPVMIGTAIANGLATLGLFGAYVRWRRWALLLIPAVPILSALAILEMSTTPDSRFSFLDTVSVVLCAVAAVWLPGAVGAVLAAQSSGTARKVGAVASVIAAALLGSSLVIVGVAFACWLGSGECV